MLLLKSLWATLALRMLAVLSSALVSVLVSVLVPTLLLAAAPARAADAPSAAVNPEIEARMMAVAVELRCLVCQNQTIADSHSGLAEDLRQQIREMLAKGMTEDQIKHYMTDRYGDFVLYRPPFKSSTWVLWVGPGVLMVGALAALALVLRRRQRLGADAFDPDTPEEDTPR